MNKGLHIAAPPPRRQVVTDDGAKVITPKFNQTRETDTVQFNKRVKQSVADGYNLLAIRTRRNVPDLLAEACEMLQEKYGKV